MQWRDVTRQLQQRAGEAQLARRAQRVPVFDYGVAVLAVHEIPPHRLNWLLADMPSAFGGGFRFICLVVVSAGPDWMGLAVFQ